MVGSVHIPRRYGIWAVLLFGCLAGLSTYVVTPLEQPNQVMLATDVYRHATASWLAGGDLYGNYPSDRPGYAFLYPPIAVLVFIPHALLWSDVAAYSFQTVINLAAAIATGYVIYAALARREMDVDRRDLAILIAFLVLSSYSAIQFLNGQVNLWLALAIAIGFEAADRNRNTLAGLTFAIAALLKVFPAILGLWLLRNRRYRALGVALGTGVGGLLAGAVLFGPELTVTYLEDVLLGRFEGSTYDHTPDPSDNVDGIHRHLAALWPTGGAYHTLIALLVMVPLATLSMWRVETRLQRDVAGLGILTSILLFLPLQPLYFPLIVFPLAMLLYTLDPGFPRYVLLAGTLLTLVHLDVESIVLGLQFIPVPAVIESVLLQAATTVFTYVLPPTMGLWLLLFACVLVQLDSDGSPDPHVSV